MKNNKSTIRNKLLLVAILPALSLAVLLLFYFVTQRGHDIEESLDHEVTLLAEFIAKNSEFDMITGNFSTLQQTLQRIAQDKYIIYIKILDNNNHEVALYDKRVLQDPKIPSAIFSSKHLFNITRPIIITSIPVNDYKLDTNSQAQAVKQDTKLLGKVIVGATNFYAMDMKRILEIQAFIIIGIALSLAVIFAIFLAQTVSRPLTLLADGIEKIKAGNLHYRIKEQSNGEIGLLEKNINEMAGSLARAQTIERRQAANLLQTERNKAHTTLESIGEGIITTNEKGVITYINPTAMRLTGYRYEEAMGKLLTDIFISYFESTQEKIIYPIDSCLKHGHIVRHDALLKLIRKDGEEFIIRDTATPIRDHNSEIVGAVVIFDDFSTLHDMAEKLVYQAAHDDLTELYNRREFENQLDLALNDTKQHQTENFVLFLDLDQFKVINDSCGHIAGDQLLRQISQVIKSKIRDHDILARLGGDEFGIILRNCPRENAIKLAQNMIRTIQSFVFYWGNQKFNIGACLGMVELNNKFINISDVLMAADSACYLAKESGGNNVHEYQPSDREQQRRRSEIKWVQRLKSAVDKNNFVLYAQRIHALQEAEQQAHYEILLRLDLDGNIYTPATFLSAAERYNLMPEIDKWVIQETFSSMESTFRHAPHGAIPHRININLSGQSLTRQEFQQFVYDTVMKSTLDHSLITFEITETATIANLAHAIEFMKTLKHMGCRFALDDFGSGLSSFGYLTSLPLDYIKIDGKIVRDIVTNPINRSIVDSIKQISNIMNLKTIAEFAESEAIIKQLKQSEIDYVQGFYLDTPAPFHKILLQKN